MGNLKPYRPKHVAVSSKTAGNPEGKGLNGFLLDWYRSEPRNVVAKTQRQVLAEFFTSLLVLSAAFKYKPAVGTANYLYWIDGSWSLSLISPDEWSDARKAGFAGVCVLHPDMTWTIDPSDQLMSKGPVAEAVARFYEAFAETMQTSLPLEDILPFYVERMPYYQRLYASALSRSVRGAVRLGGQTNIRSSDWRQALPRVESVLLTQKD